MLHGMEHVIGSDHEFTVPKCQIMRLLYFSTLELGFFMGILNIISFRTKTRYTFFSSKKKIVRKKIADLVIAILLKWMLLSVSIFKLEELLQVQRCTYQD